MFPIVGASATKKKQPPGEIYFLVELPMLPTVLVVTGDITAKKAQREMELFCFLLKLRNQSS